jgi:cyclopropane-fatty-acyl-phospholipid synthase
MLDLLLRHYIHRGTLTVHYPGKTRVYGAGSPQVAIRLHDRMAAWALSLDPDLKLGELYMEGRLTIADGDIVSMLDLLVGNVATAGGASGPHRFFRFMRRVFRLFGQWNPVSRAQAHVHHHYDLSARLYDLFLDVSRQYSCAYFAHDDDSLEMAQAQKKRHITAKLHFDRPGLKVLDIGCGWGGLRWTSPASTGPRCWASPCPPSRSPMPGSWRGRTAWPITANSS